MKCLTITERVIPHIEITHREDLPEPCILVGDLSRGYSPFPLSNDLANTVKRQSDFLCGLEDRLNKKPTPENLQALLEFMRAHDPRTNEENFTDLAEAWAKHSHKETHITKADISTNDPVRITRERNPRSDMALVLVDTQTAEGGELWLEANSYQELVEKQGRRERVVRAYDEFPAAGVCVLAAGTGANGELRVLCTMKPGASFRICRSGVDRGTSPVLITAWTGSKLRVFAPKKYQQAA